MASPEEAKLETFMQWLQVREHAYEFVAKGQRILRFCVEYTMVSFDKF